MIFKWLFVYQTLAQEPECSAREESRTDCLPNIKNDDYSIKDLCEKNHCCYDPKHRNKRKKTRFFFHKIKLGKPYTHKRFSESTFFTNKPT